MSRGHPGTFFFCGRVKLPAATASSSHLDGFCPEKTRRRLVACLGRRSSPCHPGGLERLRCPVASCVLRRGQDQKGASDKAGWPLLAGPGSYAFLLAAHTIVSTGSDAANPPGAAAENCRDGGAVPQAAWGRKAPTGTAGGPLA